MQRLRLHFVLVANPTSPPALFAQVAEREQRGGCEHGTWTEGTGPRRRVFTYRTAADLALTQSGAVRVNFLEVWEQRPDGTGGYHNSWVTDFNVTLETVAAIVGIGRSRWKIENEQFNVQKNEELNAYCMPGGRIMVYSGLIDTLDLSDAELATVIGHEIAHALREHTRERVSRAYAQQLVLEGAAAVTGVSAETSAIAGMVADVTFQLPFGRDQESEADVIGLELMARAGYDPRAAVSLWNKMTSAQSGGAPPKFLSTHPSTSDRIKGIEKNLPRVLPLYAKKG